MKRDSIKWKFVVPVVVSILVILGLSGCFKYARSLGNLKAGLRQRGDGSP